MGPLTGAAQDADPAHRCAVQLTTRHCRHQDRLSTAHGSYHPDHLGGAPTPCRSRCASPRPPTPTDGSRRCAGSASRSATSCPPTTAPASPAENLGTVPQAPPAPAPASGSGCGTGTQAGAAAPLPRYYPGLAQSPLTFSVPYRGTASAAAFLAPGTTGAVPDITLTGSDDGSTWCPQPDLLSYDGASGASCPRSSTTGRSSCGSATTSTAWRRARPRFTATYRVGNGTRATSAGTRSAHLVLPTALVSARRHHRGVRNPLPAAGGTDPEDMEHIRQFAPFAYRAAETVRHRGRLRRRRPLRSRRQRRPRHAALDRELVHRVRLGGADRGPDPHAHRLHHNPAGPCCA